MDTNVKRQGAGVQKANRTVKGVFKIMLRYYIEQMKRETFYVDGSCQGIYRMVVEAITKDIEEDFSKASEYAKILEMADRFYKVVLNKDVRERVIEEDMKPEDFVKYFSDEILGEYKRRYDMSDKYQKGLITLGDEITVSTVPGDNSNKSTKSVDMGTSIPYTNMENIIENARQDIKRKKEEQKQAQEPKQKVVRRKGLKLQDRDGEIFVFDHQGGQVIVHEIGELEYTVGTIGGNTIRRYSVRKEFKDSEPSEDYVFSNINLYEMGTNLEYCEAVLYELLSDNNIKRSNAGGYIGEISDRLGELKQMKVGQEKDDGDYIYRTPYTSKDGKPYGLYYDSEVLSAVVEFARQQELEHDVAKERKDEKQVGAPEGPEL